MRAFKCWRVSVFDITFLFLYLDYKKSSFIKGRVYACIETGEERLRRQRAA